MSIVSTGSLTAYFHGVVEDAIKARHVEATELAVTYIVALLSDYARPDQPAGRALNRPLTFLLDEALHTVEPAERFDRLRTLGDGVLYSVGFFRDHFESKGVEPGYLIGIGSVAYGGASSVLRSADGTSAASGPRRGPTSCAAEKKLDIYRELADKFASFVGVLSEIADATQASSVAGSRDLLKVYERWLKTGSGKLAEALTSHGLVPMRGTKGTLQ
jgi:hypothetical protein